MGASVAAIHHYGFTLRKAVPEVLRRHDAWSPNHRRRRCTLSGERLQLGGGAGQAWPLRLLRATQRLALERAVEGLLLREHVVDDARELLGDEGARDRRRLPPRERAVEGADLGEVLDRPHRGVTEGELEVAVAVLGALVPRATARVAGAGHESAVGDEVAGAREAADPVDLEDDREGDHTADPRNPEQP